MAKKQKLSKHKHGGRNNGPSRQRYWINKTLEKHKIRNVIRATGKTRVEAYVLWVNARAGRRMK